MCVKFKSKIEGRRNYRKNGLLGFLLALYIKDHVRTDQHTHALLLLKKRVWILLALVHLRMLPSLNLVELNI